EWGAEVELFLYGAPDTLPPDAATNHARWAAMGEVKQLDEAIFKAPHPVQGDAPADLYIDAVFGTGLSRPLQGEAWNVLTYMAGRNGQNLVARTVAVDAPSGLCLDSGRVLGSPAPGLHKGGQAQAALTVTFDSPKIGHFIAMGPHVCGKLVVRDIGLGDWRRTVPLRGGRTRLMRRGGAGRMVRFPTTTLVTPSVLVPDERIERERLRWRSPLKEAVRAHKYAHGHTLVLSGGAGRTGAARLAARGALRIGAGLVTLGVPESAAAEVAPSLTAIMQREVDGGDQFATLLEDTRINALCLGPGLGGARANALVKTALEARRPTVLDADALRCLVEDDEALMDLLHPDCVLTPHGGEFAALFPDLALRLSQPALEGPGYSKVDATREAAERAGCVVLFKGPDTVIADPRGIIGVSAGYYERAAPWLATAGAGDVLSGFIAGLLSRGFTPLQAASTAAWLHVECAITFGPGLIAEDLPEILPTVLAGLDG
ncbi:MAG TPA: NAD(P)H-hydrate dehydratase, partial [Aliiroseovarius sp.]|nr:NAD(P)H-hydrate dehydratase [Aliiroseovarius sp.]